MAEYPFSAVVGQSQFKTALLLAAINPALSGVLVTGPRGCAKSTLVRALADLLPDAPFVNLPLGASEDMLTGTLDLQQVLNESQRQFFKIYRALCREAMAGKQFELPRCDGRALTQHNNGQEVRTVQQKLR